MPGEEEKESKIKAMDMFSKMVKDELIRLVPADKCCKEWELISIIRSKGMISLKSGNAVGLKVIVESTGLTRKIVYLFKNSFGINPKVMYRKRKNLSKRKSYSIIIDSIDNLQDLAPVEEKGIVQIGRSIPNKSCCMKAYLRGAFLASGSVSVSEGGYHLEIILTSENEAIQLQRILKKFDTFAKYINKKDNWILYQKNSDHICDILKITGAHSGVFKLENLKVLKEMKSSVNRMVNCETANLSKTAIAAMFQMQDIDRIDKSIGLDKLDPEILEIARLRLEYPYASLRELGSMTDPPLSKGKVTYRIKRLKEISDQIDKNI